MSLELTKKAYQKLITEDIEWLLQQPRTLEREHVEACLRWCHKNKPTVNRIGDLREQLASVRAEGSKCANATAFQACSPGRLEDIRRAAVEATDKNEPLGADCQTLLGYIARFEAILGSVIEEQDVFDEAAKALREDVAKAERKAAEARGLISKVSDHLEPYLLKFKITGVRSSDAIPEIISKVAGEVTRDAETRFYNLLGWLCGDKYGPQCSDIPGTQFHWSSTLLDEIKDAKKRLGKALAAGDEEWAYGYEAGHDAGKAEGLEEATVAVDNLPHVALAAEEVIAVIRRLAQTPPEPKCGAIIGPLTDGTPASPKLIEYAKQVISKHDTAHKGPKCGTCTPGWPGRVVVGGDRGRGEFITEPCPACSEKPKCKVCGGAKEVSDIIDDASSAGHSHDIRPCPACQKEGQ